MDLIWDLIDVQTVETQPIPLGLLFIFWNGQHFLTFYKDQLDAVVPYLMNSFYRGQFVENVLFFKAVLDFYDSILFNIWEFTADCL